MPLLPSPGKVVGTTQRQDTGRTTFEVVETLYSQEPVGTRVHVQHDQATSCAMSFVDRTTPLAERTLQIVVTNARHKVVNGGPRHRPQGRRHADQL